MRSARLLVCLLLCGLFLSVTYYVRATCLPGDTGTAGNDTITCDTSNQPATDVQGQDGDDTIYVGSGVNTSNNIGGDYTNGSTGTGNDLIVNDGSVSDIEGDSFTGNGSGSDVIVNNGTVANYINGDADSGPSSGDDTIINNGTVILSIIGDGVLGSGSGNDTIINNGNVGGAIGGDSGMNVGSGNDTIINNGNVGGDISGDTGGAAGKGNDTIINNGTVNGNIYGDDALSLGTGSDTITNNGTVGQNIFADGGSDTVIIGANTAQVGGTIDGGAGYDVLTFNLTSTDPAVLLDAAQQIAAANPAGGTITLAGHTYTWANFEELTQLLFSLARLNGLMDPLAVFCSLTGGVDVYVVSGGAGSFSLNVSAQTISNGLAQAVNDRVQIGASSAASVYAMPTGAIEVNSPNGFSFSFVYQNYCGTLPEPQPFSETLAPEATELPPYSIINQPYNG